MATPDPPKVRETARVLLLDPEDRVFLFKATGPIRELVFWLPPGGGLETGETHAEAAKREVWEELGLAALQLSPCVWERDVVVRWLEGLLEVREQYFVCRVEPFEVDDTNWDDYEREYMLDYRWWSREEILAATGEVFIPNALGQLIEPVLRGEFPVNPLRIGR